MKKPLSLAILVCAAFALCSCNFSLAPATETPMPTDTPVPTATDTPEPTATETPTPTETPVPTKTPIPTNTPRPTKTATPTPFGFLSPSYLDYFTDFTIGDGWFDFYLSNTHFAEYDVSFTGEEVKIDVDTAVTYVYLIQSQLYYEEDQPVYVEATIDVTGGPYDNHMAVVCRFTDEGWYEFSIRSGGNWEVYDFISDTKYYRLVDSGATFNINMRHDENTLGMLCDGDALTLFVNGEKIKTVHDDKREEGLVGFSVKSLKDGNSVYELQSFYAINDLSLMDLPD
mgnify:CR=1 FL=1